MAEVNPQNVKPLGSRVLVRKYQLPERIGSITVPEAWREDRSLQAFEVVRKGPDADAEIGIEVTPDDILVMRRSWQMVPHPALPEKHYFVDASDVASVYHYEEDSDEQNETRNP